MGEGGGAVDCEEFVALEAEEPELDRIDRIPEFQDWGPERGRTGVSALSGRSRQWAWGVRKVSVNGADFLTADETLIRR